MKSLGKIVIVGTIAAIVCGIAMIWQSPASLSFAGKQDLQAVPHGFLESSAVEVAYEKYLKDFKKTRSDVSRANFEATFRMIQEHNAIPNRPYDYALNQYSDLSDSEIEVDDRTEEKDQHHKSFIETIFEIDWLHPYVSVETYAASNRNWLWASIRVLEHDLKNFGSNLHLITDDLKDCNPTNKSPNQAFGKTFSKLISHSTITDGLVSGSGCDGEGNPASVQYTIGAESKSIKSQEDLIKILDDNKRPVVVHIIYPESLKSLNDGATYYKTQKGEDCNPSTKDFNKNYVVLTGYQVASAPFSNNCKGYWQIEDFDGSGNIKKIKICEPTDNTDKGACEIRSLAVYPKISKA